MVGHLHCQGPGEMGAAGGPASVYGYLKTVILKPVYIDLPTCGPCVQVLTGRANSTVLTQLNAADPQSHGSPGLFPLFMRLKGDACSARLGLQPGDAPAATANDLAVAVRHRSSLRTGGGTAHSMRSSWKWGWWGKRWEGVQAGGGEEAEADRWAGAMVGCSMALRTSDEPGTAAVQWWAFECGVVLPPAAPPPPLAGGPGARRGSGTWHVDDTAAAAGQRGRSRVGGAAGQGLGGREEGAGTAAWGGGGELLQQQEEDEPLRDACGGAPGGAAAGLSGPPLVAVLEPVQSGLLVGGRGAQVGTWRVWQSMANKECRRARTKARSRTSAHQIPSNHPSHQAQSIQHQPRPPVPVAAPTLPTCPQSASLFMNESGTL